MQNLDNSKVNVTVTTRNPNGGETETVLEFKRWNFPGGEIGVQLHADDKQYNTFRYQWNVYAPAFPTAEDVLCMQMLVNAIRQFNVHSSNINVFFTYLPYARQDRVCHEGEAFALQVFVNSLKNFGRINMLSVMDLHSDVARQLLSAEDLPFKVVEYEQIDALTDFCVYNNLELAEIKIIAPDAGAKLKLLKQFEDRNLDPKNIHCLLKTRNGSKVEYKPYLLTAGKYYVVDDICDGGATFIALAEMLKNVNPEVELELVVTHGIFSKGDSELKKFYGKIHASNLLNKHVAN